MPSDVSAIPLSFTENGGSLAMAWTGQSTSTTLTFAPGKGAGSSEVPVCTIAWKDASGEHVTDDIIANPPVAA